MRENIKISVVVPVFNLEKYIKSCVNSILLQTHNNIEVILVDDGSTDDSRLIIKELCDKDSRIISIFKENGGVTSARLAGVQQASGEWIGFVDADDEIESDMYEVLLNNALKFGADISHCGYQMIFSDNRVNYFYNTGCHRKQDKVTGLRDLLDGSMIEPGLCNKLFKKDLLYNLIQSEKMNTDIKNNEDLLMNYYLFSYSKLSVFEDVCKYHYLVRNGSASRKKLNVNRIYDPIKVKALILSDSDVQLREDAERAYINTCLDTYNTLICADMNRYKNDIDNVKKLIQEHKKYASKLNKKRKIMLWMCRHMTVFYNIIYLIYVKHFATNRYK